MGKISLEAEDIEEDNVRPEFYMTKFAPNEYIAACEWETGTELTATCLGNKITIKLDTHQGNNVWSATPVYENGTAAGGTEMLYPISGTNDYAFCGSIYDGHSGSHVSGEFYPVAQVWGGVPGDAYGHGKLCEDVLDGQSGAQIASWHHHLTNVKNKNHS